MGFAISLVFANTIIIQTLSSENPKDLHKSSPDLTFSPNVFDGCTSTTGQYPATTYTPACEGAEENMTSILGKFGQFTKVNVTKDVEYTFKNGGVGGFITIADEDGNVILAAGASPLTWKATSTGVIRYYSHLDEDCGTSNTLTNRTVKCNPIVIEQEGCFSAPNGQFPAETVTPTCNGIAEDITGGSGKFGQYAQVKVEPDVEYTFTIPGIGGYITITNEEGNETYIHGISPITWTATSSEVIRYYSHEDENCSVSDVTISKLVKCGTLVNPPYDEPDYPCYQGDGEITDISNGINIAEPEILVVAEDIVVEPNTEFTIRQITMSVLSNDELSTATLRVYKNDNGKPGEFIQEENLNINSTQTYGFNEDYAGGLNAQRLEFTLANPVILNEGNYWFSVITPKTAYWITTKEGTSGSGYTVSFNQGQTWIGSDDDETKFVFYIEGECEDLAVQDLNSADFAYYPNPVQDVLYIKSNKTVKTVQVFNIAGQEVKLNQKLTNNQLNVQSLSAGVYLIRATLQNGEVETFKIIKK